jgi:flagellar hook-basal body complex protein FliE
MKIFNDTAFTSAAAAQHYRMEMRTTNKKHMLPSDSPYFGTPKKALALEKKIGAEHVTGAGTFEQAMLQALDKVSHTQHFASDLQVEAIINPDSIDAHDVTMAQAEATMALNITRNILNRLTQGWRDLINTR